MGQGVNGMGDVRQFWRMILWSALALLLLLPALAMQLTPEVSWTAPDFAIMGTLLAAVGIGVEAAIRFLRTWTSRAIAIAAVFVMFMAVWVELAVGIFGTPFAGS